MTRSAGPPAWLESIPREDVEAFAGGYEAFSRPPTPGERTALIVVDMTWEFVDDAYPTGFGRTGWPAVEAGAELLAAARDASLPIYHTKAFADPDHEPIRSQKGVWKPSQQSATDVVDTAAVPGDTIVPELEPRSDEIVIYKQGKASGFFGTTLAADLMGDRVDTVLIAGMATSGCVRATALDAFQYNLQVMIAAEACADRSQISHAVTLFDMQMKYADVVGLDQALELLERGELTTDG